MKRLTTPALRALQALALMGLAAAAHAEEGTSLFGQRTASVTYGPYFRAELLYGQTHPDGGYWRSPGFDPDPEIHFNLSGENVASGSVSFGYDWQNGLRADIGLLSSGKNNLSGPCISASDGSSCATHADIDSASVQTTAIMANVFYAPWEARGSNAVLQPFVSAGIGHARNEVGDWTRANAAAGQPSRTFSGDTTSSFAWSVGAGVSYQISRPGKWPVIAEASLRYYDFGTASGGADPLQGSGMSQPVTPLTFDNRMSVLTIGIRIPLERY